MPFSDLKAIIEFIYRGEITVSQTQLSSVLRSAEALKVKGLSDAKRQMDSEDGTSPLRKKRRRRRKNKSNQENLSEASNGNEKDHIGDENTGSNDTRCDKNKESDDETSEYTDEDDETEKEDSENSIMVTQQNNSGRTIETNNNDNDFEPAR